MAQFVLTYLLPEVLSESLVFLSLRADPDSAMYQAVLAARWLSADPGVSSDPDGAFAAVDDVSPFNNSVGQSVLREQYS